jgi:hypothetical protein
MTYIPTPKSTRKFEPPMTITISDDEQARCHHCGSRVCSDVFETTDFGYLIEACVSCEQVYHVDVETDDPQ